MTDGGQAIPLDTDLTRAVAEKVMGWEIVEPPALGRAFTERQVYIGQDGQCWRWYGAPCMQWLPWQPLSSMDDAMMIIQKLRAEGWGYRVGDHLSDSCVHWAEFGRGYYDTYEHGWETSFEAAAPTPQRAIVLGVFNALRSV